MMIEHIGVAGRESTGRRKQGEQGSGAGDPEHGVSLSVCATKARPGIQPLQPGRKMSRRWSLLLPVIFVTYSLAYLDRANFSFGAAAGMAHDLAITSSQSAWIGALFFL